MAAARFRHARPLVFPARSTDRSSEAVDPAARIQSYADTRHVSHNRWSKNIRAPRKKSAQDSQSRPACRGPSAPCGPSWPIWCAEDARGLAHRGATASRSRVERLMRHHGISAITARRFRLCTTDSRHDLPIAPNRLAQNFAARRPQVRLADITYVPTGEGWLYLAVALDLFTRKIVGWAMRDHMRRTIAALIMAIQRQKSPQGLIHHSDRGSQYA